MSDGLKKGSNKIIVKGEEVRTCTLILKFRDSSRTFYMRAGWRSFCRENGLKPGDTITFKLESNNTKTPLLCFSTAKSKTVSTKDSKKGMRKITRVSSERVSLSSSSSSKNQFVTLTVSPACLKNCKSVSDKQLSWRSFCSLVLIIDSLGIAQRVYAYCLLFVQYLPLSFTRANKMENAGGKKITLLDKHGVKWPVNLLIEKVKGRMHLGSGYKEFINAIGIEAYDSFVLELVWEATTTPILKFCSKIKALH